MIVFRLDATPVASSLSVSLSGGWSFPGGCLIKSGDIFIVSQLGRGSHQALVVEARMKKWPLKSEGQIPQQRMIWAQMPLRVKCWRNWCVILKLHNHFIDCLPRWKHCSVNMKKTKMTNILSLSFKNVQSEGNYINSSLGHLFVSCFQHTYISEITGYV